MRQGLAVAASLCRDHARVPFSCVANHRGGENCAIGSLWASARSDNPQYFGPESVELRIHLEGHAAVSSDKAPDRRSCRSPSATVQRQGTPRTGRPMVRWHRSAPVGTEPVIAPRDGGRRAGRSALDQSIAGSVVRVSHGLWPATGWAQRCRLRETGCVPPCPGARLQGEPVARRERRQDAR
jgi:hypothetical protein